MPKTARGLERQGATKVGSRKAGEGLSSHQGLWDSTREEAWGRVTAAHRGVKVSAERKTRRDLCSKWQLPNSADFGRAQARGVMPAKNYGTICSC